MDADTDMGMDMDADTGVDMKADMKADMNEPSGGLVVPEVRSDASA
jgi:hypothetical protein